MKNRRRAQGATSTVEDENLSIEKYTKLRMANIIIALTLLFAFVAVRIYRIQHYTPQRTNDLIIHSYLPAAARAGKMTGQYARVSYSSEQFQIEKLSVIPIYVNDKEISNKAALDDGDIVKVGSTLMWFQTFPSSTTPRIIYRQPRRGQLRVTIGSDEKKCDIIMSDLKPKHATLTFDADKYTVTVYNGTSVRLPFREAVVQRDSQEFTVSDNLSEELLILGDKKILFPYQKGQKVVQISVLEREENQPERQPSIWQAKFIIPTRGQQISLSKERDLTISGVQNLGDLGNLQFRQFYLMVYAGVIFSGFILFLLARKKKLAKYVVFWAVTFWAVLGSAVIFVDSQKNMVVEEDFLQKVVKAAERGILYLDDENFIHLKSVDSLKREDLGPFADITTGGRGIQKFITEHNNFVQTNGRIGKDWFLIDEKNRRILGLKREAVTISDYRRLGQSIPRGRFLDRDGKSVARLVVIEGNKQGLTTGSEIWLGLPGEQNFRKDIIFSNDKEDKTLFNIDKLKIVWRKGKIVLNNWKGDQNSTLYTKIKVPGSDGTIYDYPVKRKIRPKMVYIFDYDEGRLVVGGEEITIKRDDDGIRLGNLIIAGSQGCIEINTDGRFPEAGIFQNHLKITKRGESYYAQNVGIATRYPPRVDGAGPDSRDSDTQKILINGRSLRQQEESELQPSDFIRLGDLLLEFIPQGEGLLAGNREDGKRYYPINLSQTVGYFSYPDLKGNLERIFDKILSNGEDVVLTIDDDLQRIVINELKLGLKKAGLTSGAVVILDAQTGDILAIASEPDYDQNDRDKIIAAFRTDKIDPRNSPILNRALHKLYPPGSFFKIVLASAAIENKDKVPGVLDFIQTPFSHGALARRITISPLSLSKKHYYAIHPLKDHKNKTHKDLDIYEAFAKSCNIYFASLAIQLGYGSLNKAYYPPKNPLYTFAQKAYLFNDNIDLLREWEVGSEKGESLERRAGDALNPIVSEMPSNKLYPSDLSRVGIGQLDIGITPLEAAFICSIIANDGIRHTPRLIKQIGDIKLLPNIGERVMSVETAKELKTMMKRVITDGTASYEFRYSKLRNYVAGKTGTPEALDMASKSHAIFGCIAPVVKQANKPQLALAVFVEYGELASTVAVPIARRILEKAAVYYGWRTKG